MTFMKTLNDFKCLATNGQLNNLMAEGVADAITKSRTLGFPVEGHLIGDLVLAKTPEVGSEAKHLQPSASKPRRTAA